MRMESEKEKPAYLIGSRCSWATRRQDGGYFWRSGTLCGADDAHLLFACDDGKLYAELKNAVVQIQYAPSSAAQGGRC